MKDGFRQAIILPTGDEIASGIVQDTDSPMVEAVIRHLCPSCRITRKAPAADRESDICTMINQAARDSDLIILIGGSGGGHRYSRSLACDFTHSAMELVLEDAVASSLYGKNGHLWSRLVCGRLQGALVVNLPGPFREARAAMEAFAVAWEAGRRTLKEINEAMARAVAEQYGAL